MQLELSEHTVDAFLVDVLTQRLGFILTDINNLNTRQHLLAPEKEYLVMLQELADHMQAVINYYQHGALI